jgi:hypothetical protein
MGKWFTQTVTEDGWNWIFILKKIIRGHNP